ncbi:uncharacterized protein si:ch211-191i18.4 [Neolamprologus brichardi]|uniref:uncharacterized protein si:ch211-191i18.4 n=1 Tax=Neolamprologus brichardi TaxID=32507 RepID=UPI001643D574|nr:uncharacterized protein si:ch211-191i18.4 [Neolamprologus brichardi]
MKLSEFSVFLLLVCISLQRADSHLPNFSPGTPPLQVNASNIVSAVKENIFRRLPGLCRRLKRRRVTVLCNLEKFCWRGSQTSHSGQLCQCPRGSRCSHFFLHSL